MEQTPIVVSAIDHLFSTVPGVLSVFCGVIFLFYKVDRKAFNEILANLKLRAEQTENTAEGAVEN